MNTVNSFTPKDLAWHECCHAIVIRLFREYMSLERITADNHDLIEHGMLAASSIKGYRNEGLENITAMGLALVAGVIGDTIKREGIEKVKQNKEQYLLQPKALDWQLGGGDQQHFQNNVNLFVMMHNSDGVKYIQFCINLVIDFLTDPMVDKYIAQLSAALLKKTDLMLDENELDVFFEESKFDGQIKSKKEELMKRIANVEVECSATDPYLYSGPDCSLF